MSVAQISFNQSQTSPLFPYCIFYHHWYDYLSNGLEGHLFSLVNLPIYEVCISLYFAGRSSLVEGNAHWITGHFSAFILTHALLALTLALQVCTRHNVPHNLQLMLFGKIVNLYHKWSSNSSSSFSEPASEGFLSFVEACIYACIIASCSCLTAALCSWARCLNDAILCDLRSSPFSPVLSTFILSSMTLAFLCMPSNHGAELDVKWGGRGRECRTMAPYRPYSAMIELWPQHFSFLRHFARRFWNQTWIEIKRKLREIHIYKLSLIGYSQLIHDTGEPIALKFSQKRLGDVLILNFISKAFNIANIYDWNK